MKFLRCFLILAFVAAASVLLHAQARASSVVVDGNAQCAVRSVAGATNQAGLVVKFGDGRTLTYCIEFTEDSITGIELLQRSGLTVVTSNSGGLGAAVCSIDGEGCNSG